MNPPLAIRHACRSLLGTFLLSLAAVAGETKEPTVARRYPFVVSGALTHAFAVPLPPEIVARSGDIAVTETDIERARLAAPYSAQAALVRDPIPLLEQQLAARLLTVLARKDAQAKGFAAAAADERTVLGQYLERTLAKTKPAEADLRAFYERNVDACGRLPFAEVKLYVAQLVAEEQRDEHIQTCLRELGLTQRIEVSATWLKTYAPAALDNPIDRLRGKGKPVLAVFGAASCCGPDKMLPTIEKLRQQAAGLAEVVYVEARRDQGLAIRHRVTATPMVVGFDARGDETLRQQGLAGTAELLAWIRSEQPIETPPK